MKPWVPLAHEAFYDYRLNGRTLSGQELSVVRLLLKGGRRDAQAVQNGSGIAPREWRELMEMLELES